MTLKSIFNNPKMKHGTIATAITIISIIIVIGLNVGMELLSKKVNLNFDLTKNQVFNLTKESIDYIKKLDNNVTITVLNSEDSFKAGGDYFIQAENVIQRYAQNSDKIEVKYVNIEENPTFVNAFPNEKLEVNNIIVQNGDKYQVLTPYDLFNIQQSYYSSFIESSQAEQALTSAIVKVSSTEAYKVCVVTGLGDETSSGFENLLSKNNYEIIKSDILSEEISKDSQVAIIFAPSKDLDNESIEKIKNYLNDHSLDRTVLIVPDYNNPDISNMNSFLSDWGVQFENGVVFETDNKYLFSVSPFFAKNEIVSDKYSKGLKNESLPISIPFSKPIKVTDDSVASVLAKFSSKSGIMPSKVSDNWKPSESDMKPDIPCITISEKETDGKKSRVLLVGSNVAFDEKILSRSFLNNSAYFLNVFKILLNREDGIVIESKNMNGNELGINEFQTLSIGAIVAFGLPLLITCAGIINWIKRKKF